VTDYVVDTNVWMMIDESVADASQAKLDCIEACKNWLRDFVNNEDRLVLDASHEILNEYRRNIKASRRLAHLWLNQLERAPRNKLLEEAQIEFDNDGYAIMPSSLMAVHNKDRKLVAVALAHNPHPVITDAADTDWKKVEKELGDAGITVLELCPDYIQELLPTQQK
jgi:hypothetical protein